MAEQLVAVGFSYRSTYVLVYFRGESVVYKLGHFVVSPHVAFSTDVTHFCYSLRLSSARDSNTRTASMLTAAVDQINDASSHLTWCDERRFCSSNAQSSILGRNPAETMDRRPSPAGMIIPSFGISFTVSSFAPRRCILNYLKLVKSFRAHYFSLLDLWAV